MEQVDNLSAIIDDLIDRGYSLGFEASEQVKYNPGDNKLYTKEFTIDEVYRCDEHATSSEIIYIFAISSARYSIKWIIINTISTEATVTLVEIYNKIKKAFLHVFHRSS